MIRTALRRLVALVVLAVLALPLVTAAAPPHPGAPHPPSPEVRTAVVFNRPVVTFRSPFLGATSAERAEATETRVRYLLQKGGPGQVGADAIPQGVAVKIDGVLAFVLTPADANALTGETLEQAVEASSAALQRVIDETRESRDMARLGVAAARAAVATVIAVVLLWGLLRLRRTVAARLMSLTARHSSRLRVGGAQIVQGESVASWIRRGLVALYWTLGLLIGYEWLGYVLSSFPYTRPWGEQLTRFLLESFAGMATEILGALPDLAIALVIFFIARLAAHSLSGLFQRIETRQVTVDWLDPDLARPTRRIASIVVWIFALVMAYPYLPGAGTDAFRGISVLIGVMISLGGASIVGQAASGLILMYTRTVRVGEYVRIADNEGTVIELTMYFTRMRTGLGEELTIPNSLVLGSVVRNYSRAVRGRGFILDTTVTIGYDTPWRQVQAMLIEAAKRTEGVLHDPQPRVFQTALSDFYPEYRLVCQAVPSDPLPRAQVLTSLHQHIQDVFNEYGVQIMSPHYLADPADAKVVPPDRWRPAPAAPEDGPVGRTG
jgi:small-conductance mechanosensitive channel